MEMKYARYNQANTALRIFRSWSNRWLRQPATEAPAQPWKSSNRPPPAALARELIFYAWEGDMPRSVLDVFTKEYSVKIQYESFTSQDELVANLRAGKIYDVATMENRLVPALAGEGLLAELNHGNIPNLKNISANYRELSYDPGNRYSLPYNWGTTGAGCAHRPYSPAGHCLGRPLGPPVCG